MAKNIAVIGDSESIKGFAAIGMDIYPCDDNENAPHLFRKIADGDNYAVIFITEEMFGLVEKERKRYEEAHSCRYSYPRCKRQYGNRHKKAVVIR